MTNAERDGSVFLIGGGQVLQMQGQRGETPPSPDAKFKRGDVVKVRNTKALAHFPREAVVIAVIPPNFPPDWALADLLGKPRPLMHQVGKNRVTYILVQENDRTPYRADDRHILPSGKPPVEIGSVSEELP